MEQIRNQNQNYHGEITKKNRKQELLFLYAIICNDLFYVSVKHHENISKGIQVTERIRICNERHQRGDN